jgi:hypothetical protein
MLRENQFNEKMLLRATNTLKSFQIGLNLTKIYIFLSFWDVLGPHKLIWRATCGSRAMCLRPLYYGINRWPTSKKYEQTERQTADVRKTIKKGSVTMKMFNPATQCFNRLIFNRFFIPLIFTIVLFLNRQAFNLTSLSCGHSL